MYNQSLSHTKWKCQQHIVFISKYRRKRTYGAVKKDIVEIIKTLCEYKHVSITAGAVALDHVRLCVELPLKYAVSDFMGYLKGKSTLQIFDRNPEFKERGDKEFWVRGYYVKTREDDYTVANKAFNKYVE
ncbi:MAG: IS200/IS605 family transposase [Lachnospiraceae bacterium]|nr:IS200/IS605 family transposase [Lachnospiraceae bacterium]